MKLYTVGAETQMGPVVLTLPEHLAELTREELTCFEYVFEQGEILPEIHIFSYEKMIKDFVNNELKDFYYDARLADYIKSSAKHADSRKIQKALNDGIMVAN